MYRSFLKKSRLDVIILSILYLIYDIFMKLLSACYQRHLNCPRQFRGNGVIFMSAYCSFIPRAKKNRKKHSHLTRDTIYTYAPIHYFDVSVFSSTAVSRVARQGAPHISMESRSKRPLADIFLHNLSSSVRVTPVVNTLSTRKGHAALSSGACRMRTSRARATTKAVFETIEKCFFR